MTRTSVHARGMLVAAVAMSACSDAFDPAIRSGATEAELQKLVDSTVAALGIPGAVVGVRVAGGAEYVLTTGLADLQRQTPMNPANRFRIGSVTKPMVATVVLQLVDEGALSLADNISRWLPNSVANAERITVRQLLNHTSGVPDYVDDDQIVLLFSTQPERTFLASEAIAAANRQTPRFAPGAPDRWEYSNTNFILLGLIIEAVTGAPLGQVLQQRIFGPLKMASTFYATTAEAPEPFSRGYADVQTPNVDVTTAFSPTYAGAAGAVVSNAADLLVWSRALAEGALISPARHAEQTAPVLASGGEGYALGVQAFGGWIGHSGEIAGFEASVYSRAGVGTIVVLINKSFGTVSAAYSLFDAVRWAEFGLR